MIRFLDSNKKSLTKAGFVIRALVRRSEKLTVK